MAQQYHEAPPLPREPTALNVPSVMNPDTPPARLPAAVPPPPKFPSLTDVALPNALAAAKAQQSQPSSAPPPDSAPSATSSAYDFPAAIRRDSVTPGSGAKKAIEVGHRMWTTQDQRILDELLEQGQSVYVPPDVEDADLPIASKSSYFYVAVPPTDDSDESSTPVSDRIHAWNQVVSKNTLPDSNSVASKSVLATSAGAAAVGATGAAAAGAAAAGATSAAAAGDTSAGAAAAGDTSAGHSSAGATAGDNGTTDAADASTSSAAHQYSDNSVITELSNPPPSDSRTAPAHQLQSTAEPAIDTDHHEVEEQSDHQRDSGSTTSPVESKSAPGQRQQTIPDTAPVKHLDVSSTIFGGKFTTVPITSHVTKPQSQSAIAADASEHNANPTQVKLRDDATAQITIMEDYGLRGGHSAAVNDATFVDDKTLITCGADGTVCIWDMTDKQVTKEFVPYNGQAVTMVYPIPDDDPNQPLTLMTFSDNRVMRIWTIDATQAVLLRSANIPSSDKDLYMSIPFISKELKARAVAAAAAAAVTTTETLLPNARKDTTHMPPPKSAPAEPADTEKVTEKKPEAKTLDAAANTVAMEPKEEEKEKKRFSLTKVLSFGRSGRKAVAS